MTRHNLDVHISWLLSRTVTLPEDVTFAGPPIASAANTAEYAHEPFLEEQADEEIQRVPLSPSGTRQAAPVHSFVRPPLPSSILPKSQLRNSVNTESMAKLSSASKSSRPTLFSQHQLATPASTTSTAGVPATLTQRYENQLRVNNG